MRTIFFHYFGKTFIESKLNERLETHKHQQAIEIEKLRLDIDAILNRRLRLQERDFEILPSLWTKLVEAQRKLGGTLAIFQSYPDLASASHPEKLEILRSDGFSEAQIERILAASDVQGEYTRRFTAMRIDVIKKAISDLKLYADSQVIMFPASLRDAFDEITKLMWDAVMDKEIGQEEKDHKLQRQAFQKLEQDVRPKIEAIKDQIHGLLNGIGKSAD